MLSTEPPPHPPILSLAQKHLLSFPGKGALGFSLGTSLRVAFQVLIIWLWGWALWVAWGGQWRSWPCWAPFLTQARQRALPTADTIQTGEGTPGLGIHQASCCGLYQKNKGSGSGKHTQSETEVGAR